MNPQHQAKAVVTQAWSSDALSRSLDVAHANARRTFAVDRIYCDPLIEVDAIYRCLCDNLSEDSEPIAGAMFGQSHSYYLGAVSMALSGMIAEAYALLHRSLKSGMQCVFVAGQPSRQQLWINRHNDQASRASMQAEFKVHNLRRHLREIDSQTATICDKLLHRTADHSDHTNTYHRSSALPVADNGPHGDRRESASARNQVQQYCLRTAAQVGICCLTISYYAFGDCYRSVGIPDRLGNLRHGH